MLLTTRMKEIENELKNYSDSVFIVEGKKDKIVLSRLGFKNIIEISGKSLHLVSNIIQSSDSKSAVILTDFDEDGESKSSQLTKLLEKEGIKTNSFVRKRFKTLLGINKIEEFIRFTKFMEDDYHGKTCSINDKIFNRSRIYNRWNSRKA